MNAGLEAKQWRRAAALERRDALSPAARAAASQVVTDTCMSLPEVHAAARVFCFLSMPGEVDTHALVNALLAAGKAVFAPRLWPARRMEAHRFEGWDALGRGPMGILQPTGAAVDPATIDLCLTPGVAFTRSGIRLGFGGGYFDRWFERAPACRRVALAFACQIAGDLPCEPHDVLMHVIVTETDVIRPSRR